MLFRSLLRQEGLLRGLLLRLRKEGLLRDLLRGKLVDRLLLLRLRVLRVLLAPNGLDERLRQWRGDGDAIANSAHQEHGQTEFLHNQHIMRALIPNDNRREVDLQVNATVLVLIGKLPNLSEGGRGELRVGEEGNDLSNRSAFWRKMA